MSPFRSAYDDDSPEPLRTWPKQWWCNHTKRARFGPPFTECDLCAALCEPIPEAPPPRRDPIAIAIVAGLVIAAGFCVVGGLRALGVL